MGTAILGVIASLGPWGNAVANYFGYKTQKDSEANTPAMQDNATAKQDAELKAKFTKDQQTGNLDEIRKTDSH